MKQVLDLHIHSKHSRACSKELTLPNLDKACRVKGVDIIATGDFTFPAWFDDIKNKLIEERGLYKLKNSDPSRLMGQAAKVKFILSTELALIYKQGEGHARRLHLVVLAPNVKAVEKFNKYLEDRGFNIRSDGRPILGMSAIELCKILFNIDEKFMVIPAHIWTPWFAVFGSKSGFDSLEECFGEFTKNIYAYETGLSSDPEMNWRLSALDNLTLTSSSDAHSLPNIAREANVYDLAEVSYDEIYRIIKERDTSKILYTIEFYPEEGMYHLDGHHVCGVRFEPEETKKHKGICPVCKKKLVIGVEYRVDELADRPLGFRPSNMPNFKKLVELDKIIAEVFGVKSRNSARVQIAYQQLLKKTGASELDILIDKPLPELENFTLPEIVEGIKRVRNGNLIVEPGFDGQYGVVKIFSEIEKKINRQAALF
ncbi:MAG: endonuclease Q family protein [bacterium]|nr:endonuclease Q family protein [bacterium]